MSSMHIPKRLFWFFSVAVFFTSLFLYWPQSSLGFVLDSHYVIEHNPLIKNIHLAPQIWTKSLFAAAHRSPETGFNYYRPLLESSYILDYQLWGMNAQGYRIVNIFIHAGNVILVFLLMYRLLRDGVLATLTALMFCYHPVHEWTVRYIIGRGDLLQAFFSLLAFYALVKYLQESHFMSFVGSLFAFSLAFLCREVAILNVAYVLLIAGYISRNIKTSLMVAVPYLLLTFIYYGIRLYFFPITQGVELNSLAQAMMHSGQLITQLLIPASLRFLIPFWLTVLISFLVMSVLFIVMRQSKNKKDFASYAFAMIWMMIGVIPLIITQKIMMRLGPILSEHFLYFTSIGACLLIGILIEKLKYLFSIRTMILCVFVYFLILGQMAGYCWQSEESLLRHIRTLENTGNTVAAQQLLMRYDDDDKAVKALINESITAPNRSVWLKRLGNIYRKKGQISQSIAALLEAVKLDPGNIEAWNELSVAYWQSGNMLAGFFAIEQALTRDPQNSEGYRLLGTTFFMQKDYAQASQMFKQALIYAPDDLQAVQLLKQSQVLGVGATLELKIIK